MKKASSITDRFSDRHFLFFWILFHFCAIALFLFSFFKTGGTLKVDADLFNMLPKDFSEKSIEKADKKLSAATSGNVFILSCNKSFDEAKQNAEKIYYELCNSKNFKSLSLYQYSENKNELEEFLFYNRFNLIPGSSSPEEFSEKALEKIYSPWTLTSLKYLDSDPFLLTEAEMENYVKILSSSGTALSLKDGVLAREYNGAWYVLVRGLLSSQGSALASKKNGIAEIYSVCSKYEKDGQRFVYSGTAFHSHKSSNAASKEIKIISIISLAAVLLILFFVFRTPLPVLVSAASILISVAAAFLWTIAVFKKIHVLTLVFGTTLIGSCIDYSLHFFINWKANTQLENGAQIRKHLFSGLVLSLVSTEICFAILFFAPFELLKQMSLFSLTGIFSSFLSVVCIYPLIPVEKKEKRFIHGTRLMKVPSWYKRKTAGRLAICAIFIFSFICLGTGYKKCSIKNDLSRLYKMNGRLLEDQIESARVLNYAPRGWFIIKGNSEDDLIVREHKVAEALRKESDKISILCTSDFIPSIERQKKSKEIYESLFPFMKSQLNFIGYDDSMASEIFVEWNERNGIWTTFEGLPLFMQEACSASWLGKIDDAWYSVIVPSFLPEGFDAKAFVAQEAENVFYVNKAQDISRDLDVMTIMILKFFALAYVLIFVILKFFYRTKTALKIISVPVIVLLAVSSVYALADLHLEFFSITGIILVLGLGLDYVIYMAEAEKAKEASENENRLLEPFAVFLSFVTTAISFGAIALSSFMPVHLMGLSILTGLTAAYLSSFFYQRDE